MKIGDKVILIKDIEDYINNDETMLKAMNWIKLIKGNIYTVNWISSDPISLDDDNDPYITIEHRGTWTFNSRNFITIQEARKLKLKILNENFKRINK